MIGIILIFLAFAIIHSVTVSQRFKRQCQRTLGERFMKAWYRFLYNLASVITAGIALNLILQTPDSELWRAPEWLRWPMHGMQAAGFVLLALAYEHLDAWEFLGLRQLWRYYSRRETAGNIEGLTRNELITTGVYGVVRHPMYLAGIVIFTFYPIVTVNSLTVAVLADLYFIFGMVIEERRLLRIFGDRYREYAARVPMMLPRLRKRA